MRTPIYSFETSELTLSALRIRAQYGDHTAKPMLISMSNQYRRDLRSGRKECPFYIA